MIDPSARSIADVLQRFETLASTASSPQPFDPALAKGRKAFLRTASVLHVFHLADLRSADEALYPVGSAGLYILDDTVPAVGDAGSGLRTLRLDARREGLTQFADGRAINETLQLNPNRSPTDIQRLLDFWAAGETLDLAALTAGDLQALLHLTEWNLPQFFARDAVDAALKRRSAVSDFESVAQGFVGRETELRTLHEFIGIAPRSFLNEAWNYVAGKASRAMVISGVGGAGKTALVARTILDFFDQPEGERLPFVYLAFDDHALDPAEPGTIIDAAIRQLELQVSKRDGVHKEQLIRRFREELGRYLRRRDGLRSRVTKAASQEQRIGSVHELDEYLFKGFAELLDEFSIVAGPPGRAKRAPLLFVLDTFEEVEYRIDNDLVRFWQFIDLICARVPELRLLIIGRIYPRSSQLSPLQPRSLVLGDMTSNDARKLLAQNKINDAEIADMVIRQIGTNPLTLRLAGRLLVEAGGADELRDIKSRRFGILRLGQELIRGQLYRRILDHIHDADVRQLAHPGMVLRRVTADIIQDLLAPLCDLGWITSERADQLFDALAREHTLVRRDETGGLVYREEVRRPMLSLFAAESPGLTEALHEQAARFYEAKDGPGDRVEELYHLLMQNDFSPDYLNARWSDSAGPMLAAVAEELPAKARAWLASRTSLTVSSADFDAAGYLEQEQIARNEALRAIQVGHYHEALDIINRVRPAPESPLAPMHLRALAAIGNKPGAVTTGQRYLDDFPVTGNRARLAELLWLTAQSSDNPDAVSLLNELALVAKDLRSALPLVQTLAELVYRQPDDQDNVRRRLSEALLRLNQYDTYREAALIRLALVRLGPSPVEPWAYLAKYVAYDLGNEFLGWDVQRQEELRRTLPAAVRESSIAQLQKVPDLLIEDAEDGWIEGIRTISAEFERSVEANAIAIELLMLIWKLFQLEGTSLDAASLAGIEDEGDRRLRSEYSEALL